MAEASETATSRWRLLYARARLFCRTRTATWCATTTTRSRFGALPVPRRTELGPSYRAVEFDFAEEEKKMGLEPGECSVGEGDDGMPSIDCGGG